MSFFFWRWLFTWKRKSSRCKYLSRKYVYCIYIYRHAYFFAKYADQTAGGSPQMVVIVRDPNPLNSGLGMIGIWPKHIVVFPWKEDHSFQHKPYVWTWVWKIAIFFDRRSCENPDVFFSPPTTRWAPEPRWFYMEVIYGALINDLRNEWVSLGLSQTLLILGGSSWWS